MDTFKAEVAVDVTAGFADVLDGIGIGPSVSVVETLGWCHAFAAAVERDLESGCEGVVGVSDEALCRSVPCRQCVSLSSE